MAALRITWTEDPCSINIVLGSFDKVSESFDTTTEPVRLAAISVRGNNGRKQKAKRNFGPGGFGLRGAVSTLWNCSRANQRDARIVIGQKRMVGLSTRQVKDLGCYPAGSRGYAGLTCGL